MSADLFGKFLK